MRAPALLLAGALAAFAAPAQAQLIVNDPMHQALNAASWLKQAADMAQQYRQLQMQYEATIRSLGTGNIAGALGGLSRTYHPPAGTVPGLMTGQSTWGQGAAFVQQNRRYMPAEMDAWAEEMQRRERTTGNAQAIAAAGLEDTEEQIAQLEALQGQLESTETVVDSQLLNGQMVGFRQNLELNRAKLDQVQMMLVAADRVETQRAEQAQRESADTLAQSTQWAVDALGASSGGTVRTLGVAGW